MLTICSTVLTDQDKVFEEDDYRSTIGIDFVSGAAGASLFVILWL
jgi:hypothetical protein